MGPGLRLRAPVTLLPGKVASTAGNPGAAAAAPGGSKDFRRPWRSVCLWSRCLTKLDMEWSSFLMADISSDKAMGGILLRAVSTEYSPKVATQQTES